jgi:hypothetical protein
MGHLSVTKQIVCQIHIYVYYTYCLYFICSLKILFSSCVGKVCSQ